MVVQALSNVTLCGIFSFMSIDFRNGQPFSTERHGNSRLTSQDLQKGILDVGQHISGEAILIPAIKQLSEALGVTTGAFYAKDLASYKEVVIHATGLRVVEHSGLVLLGEDTEIHQGKSEER